MTSVSVSHLSFVPPRRVRREGAAHAFLDASATNQLGMPWFLITFGAALLALTLVDLVMILIVLI